MKKIIKFIKSNLLGFLVGLSLCLNGVIIAENMISSEQVTYNGTTVKAKTDELVQAADMSDKIGNTDILAVGDGTITGAINKLNNDIEKNSKTEQLGGSNSNSGNTISVNYTKFKKIGIGLYSDSSAKDLYAYTEVPIDLFKLLNYDNGGLVRVEYRDYYAYARYYNSNLLILWVNSDAQTDNLYAVAYGIK